MQKRDTTTTRGQLGGQYRDVSNTNTTMSDATPSHTKSLLFVLLITGLGMLVYCLPLHSIASSKVEHMTKIPPASNKRNFVLHIGPHSKYEYKESSTRTLDIGSEAIYLLFLSPTAHVNYWLMIRASAPFLTFFCVFPPPMMLLHRDRHHHNTTSNQQ